MAELRYIDIPLAGIAGSFPPSVTNNADHSVYGITLMYDEKIVGVETVYPAQGYGVHRVWIARH